MWRTTTVVALLCGCGISYDAGSYRVRGLGEVPPARVAFECLDLGVGLDPSTSSRFPSVRYQLGNGCDRPIRVDVSTIRAEGRDIHGTRVALAPLDAGWMAPRELSPRWFARELIRYEPVAGPADVLREVCVDVGRVHEGHGVGEHWLCLPLAGVSS
jgi:hypothetical protein